MTSVSLLINCVSSNVACTLELLDRPIYTVSSFFICPLLMRHIIGRSGSYCTRARYHVSYRSFGVVYVHVTKSKSSLPGNTGL